MSEKIIGVFSDLHCGHRGGLTHPEHQQKPGEGESHRLQKQYELRHTLWDWFDATIKKYTFDLAIWNGDMIDGKGEKSGGTELLTTDRNEQADWAAKIIRHVNSGKNYMTYGTPYHAGASEDFEDTVCKNAGCDKIENEGHYSVNGLVVAAKHFIGNSSTPVGKMSAMVRAELVQALWAELEQQPRANLIIRSHIHRCYGIVDPERNFQGWVTPALQGCGSKYGIRQRDGLPISFGILIVHINNVHDWGVFPEICPLKLQAAQVTKIE